MHTQWKEQLNENHRLGPCFHGGNGGLAMTRVPTATVLLQHFPQEMALIGSNGLVECVCGARNMTPEEWAEHAVEALIENSPRARLKDPDTSKAAAQSVRDPSETHRHILTLLREHGRMTDLRILAEYQKSMATHDWPRVSQSGLRTRRRELVDMGRVKDSGYRPTTGSGRKAVEWEAVG